MYNYEIVHNTHKLGMPPKIGGIFATKGLMGNRTISMETGMPIIGTILSLVNLPFFFAHFYSLIKDWGKISNKVTHVSQTIAHGSLATSGLIILTTKVKMVAKFLGVHKTTSTMTAAKAGSILAPIGLAIFSLLSLGMVARHLRDAYQTTDVKKRNDHLYEAVKHFFLSIALAIGTFVMVGFLAAPFGWAVLALIVVVMLLNTEFVKTLFCGIDLNLDNIILHESTDVEPKKANSSTSGV